MQLDAIMMGDQEYLCQGRISSNHHRQRKNSTRLPRLRTTIVGYQRVLIGRVFFRQSCRKSTTDLTHHRLYILLSHLKP